MILIDDREGSKEFLPLMPGAVSATLVAGDAMVIGQGPDGEMSVGVELKTPTDAATSAISGRLSEQLRRMTHHYDRSFLLIHGVFECGSNGEMRVLRHGRGFTTIKHGREPYLWAHLQSLILTARMKAGVITNVMTNRNEAAAWLRLLEYWLSKPWEKHRGLDLIHEPGVAYKSPADDTVFRVAMQMPGVGVERAISINKSFPSVKEMVEATPEQWATIEGIGPVIAREVYRALRGR